MWRAEDWGHRAEERGHRAEEQGHLKCHGQGQDRESDFPLGSGVTIPE